MVVQDVVLQEPIVRRCKDCEKNIIKTYTIDDETDDIDYFE
jgi:hypothetical protein